MYRDQNEGAFIAFASGEDVVVANTTVYCISDF